MVASYTVASLTSMAREVMLLLSRGLTNRQILDELSISERSASNHVAHVLRKLDPAAPGAARARLRVVVQRSQKGGSKILEAQTFV